MASAETWTSAPAKSSFGMLRWSVRNPPADPTNSYAGKTVLITGPNTGLGFEAATKFARLGASKLIFGVRSLDRGQEAKLKIEQATDISQDVIELFQLDMASYSSVENFVQQVNENVPTVHAAVLNAGIAPPAHKKSVEGWEMGLQVNVISTAYLGILLLPKLRQTAVTTGRPTHLEFVASVGHGDVAQESVTDPNGILKRVNDPKNFSWTKQYSITKLLEIWAMRHIADKVPSSQVIVNSSCPSLCKSDLGREFNLVIRAIDGWVKSVIARTPEEGSRILVSATGVGPECHGGFWSHDRVATFGTLVTSEEGRRLSDQFWKELLAELRKRSDNIEAILRG